MRPIIADFADLTEPGARRIWQAILEQVGPVADHQIQAQENIQSIPALARVRQRCKSVEVTLIVNGFEHALLPPGIIYLVFRDCLKLLQDIVGKQLAQDSQRLTEEFVG